jgi:hypothetical protein
MPEDNPFRRAIESVLPSAPVSGAPLPGHSDEPPEGVFAMAVSILWGVLAFACGFESVVYFNAWMGSGNIQDAVIAGIDLFLCFALGMLAVILWKRRNWLPQSVAASAAAVAANPTIWVAVVLVMLIISGLPRLQTPQIPAEEIAAAVVRQMPLAGSGQAAVQSGRTDNLPLPATVDEAKRIIDVIIPELSSILNDGDGIDIYHRIQNFNDINNALSKGGGSAAQQFIANDVAILGKFQQEIAAFRIRHKLDGAVVDWLLGDTKNIEQMRGSIQNLSSSFENVGTPLTTTQNNASGLVNAGEQIGRFLSDPWPRFAEWFNDTNGRIQTIGVKYKDWLRGAR